jgi:hypothetical protein
MAVAQKLMDEATTPLPTFGGRYRVEQLLGRGGMAEVYRVYDTSTQRQLALKRLLQRDDSAFTTHVVQLFEREFQTLSQLVHPRIIEAYDYSRDESGPYYTMELLDGGDLRELSPLPWQQAARLLSDACSALSLLHSRRLLHRDLTPLNIRCTRDGHAKLFDFGSMAQTGVNKHVVGTPPFIAPEALAGQVLDARTDLFALGATAYFALTGRHAFPARNLAALDEVWRRPVAPLSQLAPDVPAALEDLVMSLLQLTPDHRPDTAGEVMERLSAIGGFALDDGLQVQQAYLATPTLVGRDDMLARARKHLARAENRKGGALVIHGATGIGRSRFLDACALDAKLTGALILRADARDGSAGKWGAARALLRQLLAEAPELAEQALLPHIALLGQTFPDLMRELTAQVSEPARHFAAISSSETAAGELRAATQTALRAALCQVAEQRLLMIAVDDAQRIDEPSAALIALLAHEARQRRLLVFASAEGDAESLSGRAVALLLATGDSVRLRTLLPQESQQLMMSLFGAVPNVRLLADRLHAASGGSPGVIMQMAQQLLDRGVVRYGAGAWTLPNSIDVSALTSSLSEHFEATLRGLSESAGALADAFAICDVRSLSFEDCLLLSQHGDARVLGCELEELVKAEVFAREDERYFFGRPEFERIVSARLATRSDLSALHRRAASVFARQEDAQFRSALHLLHSGEPGRALDLLVPYLEQTREARTQSPAILFEHVNSLPKRWPETFHALMAACDALHRPRRDRFVLQVNLVGYAMITGDLEAEHLRQIAAQLRHDAGLDLYDQLIKEPPATRLHAALAQAIQRFEATSEHERVLAPIAAIPRLAQTVMMAVGLAGRSLDYELLAGMPSLAPLVPLSAALGVVQRDVEATLLILSGRVDAARNTFLEVLERLEQPDRAGLEGSYYAHLHLSVIMAIGQLEVALGMSTAERWAPALDTDPLFAVTACQLRLQGALIAGDLRKAEEHRAAGERLQIQNCPAQLFEGLHLLSQVIAQAEAEDLLRVKQSASDIENMARQFPAWQPCLHFARGTYQALRGDVEQGLAELELALSTAPLGRHLAWAAIGQRLLQLLNRAGRYGETLQRGNAMLAALDQHELTSEAYRILAPLALAEAALGDPATGQRYAETAINALEMRGAKGVMLGFAYEMRARVALHAMDAAAFDAFAPLCEEQYRAGQNPALIGRYKRLLRDAGATEIATSLETELPVTTMASEDNAVSLATLLSSCKGASERAERALQLITQQSQAQGGYLFTLQSEGPVLVARYGTVLPLPDLDRLVSAQLTAAIVEQEDQEETTIDAAPERRPTTSTGSAEWAGYTPMLLSAIDASSVTVVGLAVMLPSPRHLLRVPHRLLGVLSKSLIETGDVHTTIDGPWRARLVSRAAND